MPSLMRSLKPGSVILVLTALLLATLCLAACSGEGSEEGAAAAPAEGEVVSSDDFESGDAAGFEAAGSEDEMSDE